MSFSKKYSKAKKFDIVTTGFEYLSLHDLFTQNGVDAIYPLRGVYINTKGKFDDSPVFATDSYFVNIPSHMLDTAKEILADEEAVTDINRGAVAFKIYTYVSQKYNKECFGIDFVDVNPETGEIVE